MQPIVTAPTSQFERLANVVALPIGRWDRNARLIFCNTPYLAWAGRRQEELLWRHADCTVRRSSMASSAPGVRARLSGRDQQLRATADARAASSAGSRIQVFPEAGPDGTVASVFTIATDIHQDVVQRDAR